MFRSKITGLGFYVPEIIVSNDDLSKLMETSDDWISERTGIKNRRWVGDKKLTTSLMGTYAAEKAIAAAGIDKNEIDFITIASTGNAADFGDILTTTQYVSGCADSHGGLQS